MAAPETWERWILKHRICHVSTVREGTMDAFDLDGEMILVANVDGEWFAIGDTCSHAQASLSEGELDAEECTVTCPLHGAVFDLRTGEALEFPAEEPVVAYSVTVEDDEVHVEFPE